MGWQGDGTFVRTNGTNSGTETWQDDAAAATKIRADRHDSHDQDLSDGIAACLTKNMETKPAAHFVPNVTTTYNLGTASLKWEDAYINGVTTVGGNIVSDTDSTDDLGTTSVRWANLYVDAITATDSIVIGSNNIYPSVLGTPTATTSGTDHEYTSIPTWATKIYIYLAGVSTDGTEELRLELGDSGGYEQTGYVAFATRTTDANTRVESPTNGFHFNVVTAAADAISGLATLVLVNSSTNTWAIHGNFGTDDNDTSVITGYKALSAALDRVRIIADGVDAFDAGEFNIRYE